MLIKTTANAIFIGNIGVEQMPVAYFIVAVFALSVTLLYNKFVARFSIIRILKFTFYCGGIFLLTLAIILKFNIGLNFVSYALYVFVAIFGILSTSQFWLLSNRLFNKLEGRKYFAKIALGGILGGTLGGYLASVLTVFFDVSVVIFLAATILFLIPFLLKHKLLAPEQDGINENGLKENNLFEPIKIIANTRHLKLLSLFIFTGVIVAKLVDYLFGYYAELNYSSEEELTQFYGFWFSSFNVISLLLQAFVTSRLIRAAGVGYTLVLLPSLIFLNAAFLFLFPIMAVVILMKLFDYSLKQSTHKSVMEMIMLPLPMDIKSKTKVFQDVFVDSLATGMAGIILYLLVQTITNELLVIEILLIVFGVCWIVLAQQIRKEYKSVFRRSLSKKGPELPIGEGNKYKDVILYGDDEQIILALDKLKFSPVKMLDVNIPKLLAKANERIVLKTLTIIQLRAGDYSEIVEDLCRHRNIDIGIAAFHYLYTRPANQSIGFILRSLNEEDLVLKSRALAGLIKHFRTNQPMLNMLAFRQRVDDIIHKHWNNDLVDDEVIIAILKCIAYGKIKDLYPLIEEKMKSDNSLLRQAAIMSAGETLSLKFKKELFQLLASKPDEEVVCKALSNFGVDSVKKLLIQAVSNNQLIVVQKFPEILGNIPTQASMDFLISLSDNNDFRTRLNAFTEINKLRINYPLLYIHPKQLNNIIFEEAKNLNIINQVLYNEQLLFETYSDKYLSFNNLIDKIKVKIDDNLKLIFTLLNIRYPLEDYIELYEHIRSNDQILRENAIAYIDEHLNVQLKASIIPIIEHQLNIPNNFSIDLDKQTVTAYLLAHSDPEISTLASKCFN